MLLDEPSSSASPQPHPEKSSREREGGGERERKREREGGREVREGVWKEGACVRVREVCVCVCVCVCVRGGRWQMAHSNEVGETGSNGQTHKPKSIVSDSFLYLSSSVFTKHLQRGVRNMHVLTSLSHTHSLTHTHTHTHTSSISEKKMDMRGKRHPTTAEKMTPVVTSSQSGAFSFSRSLNFT